MSVQLTSKWMWKELRWRLERGKGADKNYNKPKLFIAAYHHDADIFLLPLFIWQLVPEYKVYLRKHPYVPAWELNFLAAI